MITWGNQLVLYVHGCHCHFQSYLWFIDHEVESWVDYADFNSVKSRIIYLSLLFFVAVIMMALQQYTYMKYMYLFPLLGMTRKGLHTSEWMFPSLVVLGSTVVQKNTFFWFFPSRSISRGFSMVDCSTFILMYRCPSVMLIYFKDDYWWYSLWGLAKSLGNLVWLPWGSLMLAGWKVWHGDTVTVLVWLSGK